MTAQLHDLIRQRDELEAQINAIRSAERKEAIAEIRELVATYGIDLQREVAGAGARATAGKSSRVLPAVKYQDQAGNTWTGRGLKPRWLQAHLAQGAKLEDFAVATADVPAVSTSLGS